MLAFPAVDQVEAFLTAARPFLAFLLTAILTGWAVRWDHDRRATRRQAAANLLATTCKHGKLKRRNCHDCAVEFEAEALAERGAGYRESDEIAGAGGGGAGGGVWIYGDHAITAETVTHLDTAPAKARRFEELHGLGAAFVTGARGSRLMSGPKKILEADCAQTVRFSEHEMLHGSAVRALHVGLDGCSIDDVSRIRVRARGVSIIDATPAQLWTLLRALKLSASPTKFTIPLSFGSSQGAPVDACLALELDFTRGGGAGAVQLSYSLDQAAPADSYLMFRSETLGVPASSCQYSYILRPMGITAGLVIQHLDGIDALRIYDGRGNMIADFRSGAELRDWCEWITGDAHDHDHSAWLALPEGGIFGELRLEVSTNARWAVTNEIALLSVIPSGRS